jgi:hypothetical protein
MSMHAYRWEYSPLARAGNIFWARVIDRLLRLFARDELMLFLRVRGVIQICITIALLLIPIGIFFHPAKLFTAAGYLFDIAGVLRVFLLEEVTDAIEPFKEREPVPSVAMRELIMPEASGPYTAESPYISLFLYKKRGVLFLFLGFALQMLGDIIG